MEEPIVDAVEPPEGPADSAMDQIMETAQEAVEEEKPTQTMIPLHVAQKLREKNRELELQVQWEQQERQRLTSQTPPPQEDNSKYESATREDLSKVQWDTLRFIEENQWVKEHPEKAEEVDNNLKDFLKIKPNLASAINCAVNRYKEAYELMSKLSTKEQKTLAKDTTIAPKKMAPNSPGSVPKAAALNEGTDVMGMSDSEFNAWRASKRRR